MPKVEDLGPAPGGYPHHKHYDFEGKMLKIVTSNPVDDYPRFAMWLQEHCNGRYEITSKREDNFVYLGIKFEVDADAIMFKLTFQS